jgi:ribosomal protein S18 acetylase RimI-like enzyme
VNKHQDVRIVDVTDDASWSLLPACADPRFDHRSCDYWEDGVRGLKTARASWWQPSLAPAPHADPRAKADNPFAPPPSSGPAFNPFAPTPDRSTPDPWSLLADEDGASAGSAFNPFLAPPPTDPRPGADVPRKLRLLTRGLVVFGSYAKVLLVDGAPMAYAQFGPLSAYPRAQQIRDLYPALPSSPLPAVITCVSTSGAVRGAGLGAQLVTAVIADLASRGFAAVEAYPDLTLTEDEASAAHPRFWERCGFAIAIADERYPVMRTELH